MLETQLSQTVAVLNEQLTLQLDMYSLVAPDHKLSLGQLLGALTKALPEPFSGQETLAAALEARNREVHHFYIRNNDAFTDLAVYREAWAELQSDIGKISAAAKLMHGAFLSVCEAQGVDPDRIAIRQARIAGRQTH